MVTARRPHVLWGWGLSETSGEREVTVRPSASEHRRVRAGWGLKGETCEDPPPHLCTWGPKPGLALGVLRKRPLALWVVECPKVS